MKLDAFLHQERDGTFAMYFCRGEGKCQRTPAERRKLSKQQKVCPDCIKGREDETLEQVVERIERGEA